MVKAYVEVEVDLDDLSDDLIERESRERGISNGREVVSDAINQIRRGDTAEAITTLERAFFPKWIDRAEAEADYKLAMFRKAFL